MIGPGHPDRSCGLPSPEESGSLYNETWTKGPKNDWWNSSVNGVAVE